MEKMTCQYHHINYIIIGKGSPESLLAFIEILQEELIQAKVLPQNYDFESHKELVAMQPGDVPITYADTKELEKEINFKPNTPLREELKKFVKWYKEWKKGQPAVSFFFTTIFQKN